MRLSLFLHIDKRLLTHPSPVPYHLSSGVAFDFELISNSIFPRFYAPDSTDSTLFLPSLTHDCSHLQLSILHTTSHRLSGYLPSTLLSVFYTIYMSLQAVLLCLYCVLYSV